MEHHSGYRRGLVAEYHGCIQNGQHERAEAVRAELARTGGVPDDLIPAGLEDATDASPRETAVPRRARQIKES